MRFLLQKAKAQPTETEDGELTRHGMDIAHEYAVAWTKRNARSLELERQYPELEGLFYDIRVDPDLAREHAIPFSDAKKSMSYVMRLSKA